MSVMEQTWLLNYIFIATRYFISRYSKQTQLLLLETAWDWEDLLTFCRVCVKRRHHKSFVHRMQLAFTDDKAVTEQSKDDSINQCYSSRLHLTTYTSTMTHNNNTCNSSSDSLWIERQGVTSHSTHYRSFPKMILQVRWSNVQCNSTEGW